MGLREMTEEAAEARKAAFLEAAEMAEEEAAHERENLNVHAAFALDTFAARLRAEAGEEG